MLEVKVPNIWKVRYAQLFVYFQKINYHLSFPILTNNTSWSISQPKKPTSRSPLVSANDSCNVTRLRNRPNDPSYGRYVHSSLQQCRLSHLAQTWQKNNHQITKQNKMETISKVGSNWKTYWCRFLFISFHLCESLCMYKIVNTLSCWMAYCKWYQMYHLGPRCFIPEYKPNGVGRLFLSVFAIASAVRW